MANYTWWHRIASTEFLVHITTMDVVWDILASKGITPHKPDYGNADNWASQYAWPDGGIEKRTYFGDSPEGVAQFAKDNRPVYLRVPKVWLEKCGLNRECGDYFIRKKVPLNQIQIRDNNGEWVALNLWAESLRDRSTEF